MEDRQQLRGRPGRTPGRGPAPLRLLLAGRWLRRLALSSACALAAVTSGAWAEPAPEAAPGEAAAPPGAAGATEPLAAGAAPPGAAAPAVDLAELHREAAESFYASDGDRDGFVSSPEAMEMPPERFAAADGDRDGKLTLVEWVDARFEGVEPVAPRPPP